jgi:hypothetical protein
MYYFTLVQSRSIQLAVGKVRFLETASRCIWWGSTEMLFVGV